MSAPAPDTPDRPERPRPIKVFVRPSDFANTAEAAQALYDALLEAYPQMRPAREQQGNDAADQPKGSSDPEPDVP